MKRFLPAPLGFWFVGACLLLVMGCALQLPATTAVSPIATPSPGVTPAVTSSALPTTVPRVQPWVTMEFQISEPIHIGERVSVTVSIRALMDLSGVQARVYFPQPAFQPVVSGPSQWVLGDLRAGDTPILTTSLAFPHPGRYDVYASIRTSGGGVYDDGIAVDVRTDGYTLRPTARPVFSKQQGPLNLTPIPPSGTEQSPAPTMIERNQPPAEMELQIGESIRIGQPVSLTLSMRANRDIPSAEAGFFFPEPVFQPVLLGPTQWSLGDLRAGETRSLSISLVFPHAGRYGLNASVRNPAGLYYGTATTVEVRNDGYTIRPTSPGPFAQQTGPPQATRLGPVPTRQPTAIPEQ